MSNGSPTAYLLWAILSCLFAAFLVYHLWNYDRFQCLRWNAGRQPGAFRRVMTYTYVATIPLLVLFSIAMTVLKFKEGYSQTPDGYIMPKASQLWTKSHRHWLLPLYFILSGAWALEIITHLEELTFWLFMLHQGPNKRDWFDSWEVRVWYIGCIVSGLGLPLTALISRRNIDQCEAWVFLVGSSASTSTTILFLYVLVRFPTFIRHVKQEGAEPDVVIRLATFYNLNLVRVMFRFLFTFPLLVLAIDGVQGRHRVNADPFWCDFLLIMGGIGCFISSAITLLIFFPRSITKEAGYRAKLPSMSIKTPVATSHMLTSPMSQDSFRQHQGPLSPIHTPRSPPSPKTLAMSSFKYPVPQAPNDAQDATPEYEYEDSAAKSADHTWDTYEPAQDLHNSESSHAHYRLANFALPRSSSGPPHLQENIPPDLHPYVMTFTSPIDLLDASDDGHMRHAV